MYCSIVMHGQLLFKKAFIPSPIEVGVFCQNYDKLNKDFVLTYVKDERKKIKAIPIRIKRKLRIFVEFSFVYQLNH